MPEGGSGEACKKEEREGGPPNADFFGSGYVGDEAVAVMRGPPLDSCVSGLLRVVVHLDDEGEAKGFFGTAVCGNDGACGVDICPAGIVEKVEEEGGGGE